MCWEIAIRPSISAEGGLGFRNRGLQHSDQDKRRMKMQTDLLSLDNRQKRRLRKAYSEPQEKTVDLTAGHKIPGLKSVSDLIIQQKLYSCWAFWAFASWYHHKRTENLIKAIMGNKLLIRLSINMFALQLVYKLTMYVVCTVTGHIAIQIDKRIAISETQQTSYWLDLQYVKDVTFCEL